MGFSITCTNLGCFDTTDALLDIETNEVICRNCGKSIKGVTSFAKVSLKTLGQTTTAQKKAKSLQFDCENCKKKVQPILKNDKIICPDCNKEMKNVPVTFKYAIELLSKKE